MPCRNPPLQTGRGSHAAADDGMGNVTAALRRGGLWDGTLIVWSADNGGWLRGTGSSNYGEMSEDWQRPGPPALPAPRLFPLRGGKVSDFEGGVRAVAFAAGGFLPDA
eukprot:gene527-21606_t